MGSVSAAAVLFLIFALDSLMRGHDLPTSRRAAKKLVEAIKQYRSEAKNFYDLGCAHGGLSLAIKKSLPGLVVYGIDNSAVRIFFARLKSKVLRRKVHFQKQDIFSLDTDLSQADVVYTYLWHDLMPLLEKKLQKELKTGTIVITNTSNFPTWKPIHKIVIHPEIPERFDFETLFIYLKG
jgi:SAM-dependent methyltransferase